MHQKDSQVSSGRFLCLCYICDGGEYEKNGNTHKRFKQRLAARGAPRLTDGPTRGKGVSPAQFVKIVGALASGIIHGTVIRRLQQK